MWILKLSLTTLWMAGMVAGWTLGGLLHLLAVAAVALVLVEETPFEKKLARFRFLAPGAAPTVARPSRPSRGLRPARC